MFIPPSRGVRISIRSRCVEFASGRDAARLVTRSELESTAARILQGLRLPDTFLAWTMVTLASATWRRHVATVPPERRLFLLPRCECAADPGSNNAGNDASAPHGSPCYLEKWRSLAASLGYHVAVAEGASDVSEIVLKRRVDAIVGAAPLPLLELAFERLIPAGIPCMAVPMLDADCTKKPLDDDWVEEMIRLEGTALDRPYRSYARLWKLAADLFVRQELERLVPPRHFPGGRLPSRPDPQSLDPLAATEAIAYDFLTKGGKYSRPFIALASYEAVAGGMAMNGEEDRHVVELPDAVKRVAISIETFHKASLVHDDIEDNDAFRYGEPTLHRRFGIPTAINVGDYLIGWGYRLVSAEAAALGPDTVADIIDYLAHAHLRLARGQGAELIWRDSREKRLAPADALTIYSLKTAPAFEAALYMGMRMARAPAEAMSFVADFARYVGVAFQILNDLQDWHEGAPNKGSSGGDVVGGRPTLLWALALESLDPAARDSLIRLVQQPDLSMLDRVGQLYREANVFDKALRVVDEHRGQAAIVADGIESQELRALLYYLMDTVLDGRHAFAPPAPQ